MHKRLEVKEYLVKANRRVNPRFGFKPRVEPEPPISCYRNRRNGVDTVRCVRYGCISMQRYWSSLRYSFLRTLFLLAADLRRHPTTPRSRGELGGSGKGEVEKGMLNNRAAHRSPRSRHRRAQRARQNNRPHTNTQFIYLTITFVPCAATSRSGGRPAASRVKTINAAPTLAQSQTILHK